MNSKTKRYFKRTWKNKVVSLALIGIGAACTAIDGDATFLVGISMFAIPGFIVPGNWVG